MQVNFSTVKQVVNRTSPKTIKNVISEAKISMPKTVAGFSAAALSGMYLVNKAIKNQPDVNVYNDAERGIRIKTTCSDKETYVHTMTREYKNPITGRNEVLKMELSDVAGVYNSTITDDMGNTRVESSGYKNPDGSIVVEKNLQGLDGTMTHYTYEASSDEKNIKTTYQITSSEGEVLTSLNRTFNRINPNLAYSSVNGKEYKIEKQEDKICVTEKQTNTTTEIELDEIFYDDEAKAHPELIDKMSGDMLIDMYKRGYRYNYIDNADITEMEPCEKILSIKNDLFDFSHELGHTKDLEYDYDEDFNLNIKYNLAQNPEFREIFEQEREAFIKAALQIEQKYVDYFIEKEGHYNEENGGAAEFIAEANALLSTSTGSACNDHLCARDYYLQKYFPRSIAAASKILFS